MQPTEELRQEHEIILSVLATAAFEVQRIAQTYKIDPAKIIKLLDFFRGFTDRCHYTKEELHLFPLMEKRGQPTDTGLLAVLREEHVLGRIHLKTAAKALTQAQKGDHYAIDDVAASLGAYVDLLRIHIAKENKTLFPLVDALLSASDQEILAQSFAEVDSQVMGADVHEKYLRLAHELSRGDPFQS